MAYNEIVWRLEAFTDVVEFERLACDVLERYGHDGIEPQGVGRIDGGQDAILRRGKNKRVYHFSLRQDWNTKLNEDLETVKTRKLLKKGQCFIFVSNRHVPAPTATKLKREVAKTYGWRLDLWPQERLRVALENKCKDLADKYLRVRLNDTGALRHLEDLQEQVVRPLMEEVALLEVSVLLEVPPIVGLVGPHSEPNPLMSGGPKVTYVEDVFYPLLRSPETALFEDARNHHFSQEIEGAYELERKFILIAQDAADLAKAIGQRFAKRLPLPNSANALGGSFANVTSLGVAVVNKLLGVHGGDLNLVNNGAEIRNRRSDITYMRGSEQERNWCMSLADTFVLDPANREKCAGLLKRFEELRPLARKVSSSLERALARKNLPGPCELS